MNRKEKWLSCCDGPKQVTISVASQQEVGSPAQPSDAGLGFQLLTTKGKGGGDTAPVLTCALGRSGSFRFATLEFSHQVRNSAGF